MKRPIFIFLLPIFFLDVAVFSQHTPISIATDVDIQFSLKKDQRYRTVGQTALGEFHFAPKETLYLWFAYYSSGKFSNDLFATAKSISTNPQQVNYVNTALMRFKHLSVGWKHFLKGTYDSDGKWNLYGYAGLGLMLGLVQNSYSVRIDTAVYNTPVRNGRANFKRLTLDLGLGYEIPIGSAIYFYNEVKVWIPTTDYPSPYIYVNKNAPLMAALNFGIRILLD